MKFLHYFRKKILYKTSNFKSSYSKLNNIFISITYSLLTINLISGIKIINPKFTDWLSVGDGTAEISWEFFRHQPILQFPLGLNPKYGLEISSTSALDGQIPLFSFIFHPISNLLPERFQYIGIFITFTFAMNFYFANKIFLFLNFNKYQSIISSIILASSPVILNRFIENTHYSLISGWVIFYAIYLALNKNFAFSKWFMLFGYSVLTHLYYLPFLFSTYLFSLVFQSKKRFAIQKKLINFIFIIISTLLLMYISGYFYGGSSSKDVGYGLFRSTLLSPFDSSGWSRLIPDFAETEGSYEGFSYIGLPSILVFVLAAASTKRRKLVLSTVDFFPLWMSAFVLFLFSLSNKIAIGTLEIIEFTLPNFLTIIPETFRSTGRFSWLFVFTFFIYFSYQLKVRLSNKAFSKIITLILILGIIDSYPQIISQKQNKFNIKYENVLSNDAWNSISECYTNLRIYPPTVGVENYYEFVQVAVKQGLGINTGRFGRVNQNSILSAYDTMHREFNTGVYRNDSFYIFSNAEFVLPEIVNYQKNLAIHTLDDESARGQINGFTFIAPNLKSCLKGNDLKLSADGFGAPKTQKYRGEEISFGKNLDSSKYILIGFSALEEWGVWSVDAYSKINFNTENISNFDEIVITARDLASPKNSFMVSLNDYPIGTCTFSVEFSTCRLPFEFKKLNTNIISLSFSPKLIRSPSDLGLSDDKRNLGFGMKSISFN